MFKKITAFTILLVVFSSFAYTLNDISQANYLASKKIIKDWSSNPANYRFDDYIARSEIMGMALAMEGITRNTHCRGDFVDVPKSDTDWVCRTIETAADNGLINAKPIGMKTRPYANITRAEALGILTKKILDPRDMWAGYSYYWESSLPNNDSTTGYKDIYPFGAEWQAQVFYGYIRKILQDDSQLYVNPRANKDATRGEVFQFAYTILEAQNPVGVCGEWNNSEFSSINNSEGLDPLALSGTNDKFCSSGTMSHLYENNTGIAWSCDGTKNRICMTNAFQYGTKRLRVDSVIGVSNKGEIITLQVQNFTLNPVINIWAGNYKRFGTLKLIEGYQTSPDMKQITFILPDNLNGSLGDMTGKTHIPGEPYAIYLKNSFNGEYVKLYNPFGNGATQ